MKKINDHYFKIIFTGIFITLVFMAFKSENIHNEVYPPNLNVEKSDKFIQIAPNVIGILDEGRNSGIEQLVIFRYNPDSKTFQVESTLDYSRIFTHPEQYGIPRK